MNSPILKLQADAVNEDVPVAELLRSAYLVARKLQLAEFTKENHAHLTCAREL